MHQLTFHAALGLSVLLTAALVQDESGICSKQAESCSESNCCDDSKNHVATFRLKNAAAEDVASAINQWFEIKCDGKCECPVVVEDAVTNSLLVKMNADCPESDELANLINELDKRPPMVWIDLCIKEKSNGKTTTLSCPKIACLDNMKGFVELGSVDESLIVEVLPRIVCCEDSCTIQAASQTAECTTECCDENDCAECPQTNGVQVGWNQGIVGVDFKFDETCTNEKAFIQVECEAEVPFLKNIPYVSRLFKNKGLAVAEVPVRRISPCCESGCDSGCEEECYEAAAKHICVERGVPMMSNGPHGLMTFTNIGCVVCETQPGCADQTKCETKCDSDEGNPCCSCCRYTSNMSIPYLSGIPEYHKQFSCQTGGACCSSKESAKSSTCCDTAKCDAATCGSNQCCPSMMTTVADCPMPPVAQVGFVFEEEDMPSVREVYDAMYELQVENERLQVEMEATREMAEMMEEMWKLKAENAVLKAKLEMHQKHQSAIYHPHPQPTPQAITYQWRSNHPVPVSSASVQQPPHRTPPQQPVTTPPKNAAPVRKPYQPHPPKAVQPPKQTQQVNPPVFTFYSGSNKLHSAPVVQSPKSTPPTLVNSGVVAANPNHPAAKQVEIKQLMEQIQKLQAELNEATKQNHKSKSIR